MDILHKVNTIGNFLELSLRRRRGETREAFRVQRKAVPFVGTVVPLLRSRCRRLRISRRKKVKKEEREAKEEEEEEE
ncbi:hypothetical protein V1477_017140 [Vespula maculifrons]|uniref:Uncharacterized protein n=1 Tax=Vespula maculifrons TaxID=7453 RepID=A0ABD2B568_VESMC